MAIQNSYKCEKSAPEEPKSTSIPRAALSMEDFAMSFGMCRSTAYAMLRAGLLNTFTIGRRRFVALQEAQELAKRLTAAPEVATKAWTAHANQNLNQKAADEAWKLKADGQINPSSQEDK